MVGLILIFLDIEWIPVQRRIEARENHFHFDKVAPLIIRTNFLLFFFLLFCFGNSNLRRKLYIVIWAA